MQMHDAADEQHADWRHCKYVKKLSYQVIGERNNNLTWISAIKFLVAECLHSNFVALAAEADRLLRQIV